ncbi:hypothetical protein CDAR_207271 [Caerostris darwini]|uniref:Uncharacterized protein n=1 Tax=Caerostris darwini TaxID=1538125 RepID=A0AAV4MFB5_9ARAC|nr:hypothetical protein CDAR_207271 [Caerostris darwini]
MAQYDRSVKSQYNSDPSVDKSTPCTRFLIPEGRQRSSWKSPLHNPPLTPFPRPNLSELFVAQGSRD